MTSFAFSLWSAVSPVTATWRWSRSSPDHGHGRHPAGMAGVRVSSVFSIHPPCFLKGENNWWRSGRGQVSNTRRSLLPELPPQGPTRMKPSPFLVGSASASLLSAVTASPKYQARPTARCLVRIGNDPIMKPSTRRQPHCTWETKLWWAIFQDEQFCRTPVHTRPLTRL